MSQRVDPIKALLTSGRGMRIGMNLWPPFLFTGIRILKFSSDFRYVKVRLKKRKLTSNYVGTLFGGSLFSMTDPFFMIMAMKSLGQDYIVWDKRAEIEFVSPGKEVVFGEFKISDEDLDDIKANVSKDGKYLKWFEVEIKTAEGILVAIIKKQIYFRAKK